MRAVRVVFLLQDLCIGGTQRQTLALAAGLDRGRFRPELWTLSGPTELDAEAREQDLPVTHLGNAVFPGLHPLSALWAKLGREKPDVFFLCTALPNIWGRVLGRLRRLPLVFGSCRGGGAPARQHERMLWRLARHIVCNSPALIEVMAALGVPRARMSYIPNGVDTARFQPGKTPLDRREALILCTARLVEDKDPHCLLDAFASVLDHMPDARLRLVGEGPLTAALRAKAEAPLFRGRVELWPANSDIAACCREARVFALSSRREGMPNALLEAMSAALPAAASGVGAVPFLLHGKDGAPESGFPVQQGNASALAEALLRLLREPEKARRMGEAGRERVKRDFSFNAMIAAHEELFLRYLRS